MYLDSVAVNKHIKDSIDTRLANYWTATQTASAIRDSIASKADSVWTAGQLALKRNILDSYSDTQIDSLFNLYKKANLIDSLLALKANLASFDSLARAALSSSATGLSYNNLTGAFSWATGYEGFTTTLKNTYNGYAATIGTKADSTWTAGQLAGKSDTGHVHSYNSLTDKPTLGSLSSLNSADTSKTQAKVISINGEIGSVVLTTADIDTSGNKKYITQAQLDIINNLSGLKGSSYIRTSNFSTTSSSYTDVTGLTFTASSNKKYKVMGQFALAITGGGTESALIAIPSGTITGRYADNTGSTISDLRAASMSAITYNSASTVTFTFEYLVEAGATGGEIKMQIKTSDGTSAAYAATGTYMIVQEVQ